MSEGTSGAQVAGAKPVSFRDNNFDLLRLLAATQVLVLHATRYLDLTLAPGMKLLYLFPGVPIFFVISGYLISASFERSSSVWIYFQNRVLRIYPGLWFCILVTVAVATYFGFNFFQLAGLKWFVTQLLALIYTPNFLRHFGFGAYNGALWTIPVELQFYVLLPFIYLLARHVKVSMNAVLVAVFVFFCAAYFVVTHYCPDMYGDHEAPITKLIRYTFVPRFYFFLAGVLLQRYGIFQSRYIHGRGLYWLLGYLCISLLLPHNTMFRFLESLLLAVTIISLAYTLPGLAKKLLRGNDISYGTYIYHGLIINIMLSLGLTGSYRYLFVVWFGAYAAGAVSWFGIERRFLRRKKETQHAV